MRKSTILPALVAACALVTGALTTAAPEPRALGRKSRGHSPDGRLPPTECTTCRTTASLCASTCAAATPRVSKQPPTPSRARRARSTDTSSRRPMCAPVRAGADNGRRGALLPRGQRLPPARRAGEPRVRRSDRLTQERRGGVRGAARRLQGARQGARAADRNLSVPAELGSSVTGVIGVDEAQRLLQPNNTTGQAAPHNPAPAGFRNAPPCSAYWAREGRHDRPAVRRRLPDAVAVRALRLQARPAAFCVRRRLDR